ncbi:MAG: YdeI/OmpD-associated family protein [Chthoniobacterales bacterium]
MKIVFFPKPLDFRKWLLRNHTSAPELLVGFHKKHTGQPSITWPESVDEALSFGWIDGIRGRIDESSYTIRFTPRRRGSIWSAVNMKRVDVLTKERRMQPAGLTAFAARQENKSGIYAYEQRREELPEPYAGMLKKNKAAWKFFQAQAPSYRKTISWWVTSARQEATRRRRLEKLADACAHGLRLR